MFHIIKVHILNVNFEVCFDKISIDVYIIGTHRKKIHKNQVCLSLNTKKRNLLSFKSACGELDDISVVNF